MLYNQVKKTMRANRGVSIALAVALGVHLLVLCIIMVVTLINRQHEDVAVPYLVYIGVAMFVNLWVFILCNLSLYTSGYATAVGAGMPRKTYLRGAGCINLMYVGALLLLSVCGSAVCLALVKGNPAMAADKVGEFTSILLYMCAAQVVLHLFYAALGFTMGWLILRIGVKMAGVSMGVLSVAGLFVTRWIDLFVSLPDEQKLVWIVVMCGCGLVVTAALAAIGDRQLKRINI